MYHANTSKKPKNTTRDGTIHDGTISPSKCYLELTTALGTGTGITVLGDVEPTVCKLDNTKTENKCYPGEGTIKLAVIKTRIT